MNKKLFYGIILAGFIGLVFQLVAFRAEATYHGYKWQKTSETACVPSCGQTGATHEVTYTCVDMPGNDHDQCGFTLSCPETWSLVNGSCWKFYGGHLHSQSATKTPDTKTVVEECSIPEEDVKACEPQPCDLQEVEVAVALVEIPCVTPTPVEPTPTPEADHNAAGNPPSVPTCTMPIEAPKLQGFDQTSNTSVFWHWWKTPNPIVSQWIEYGYEKGNYPYSVFVPNDSSGYEIGALDPNAQQNWARVGVMNEQGCVAYSNDLDPKKN